MVSLRSFLVFVRVNPLPHVPFKYPPYYYNGNSLMPNLKPIVRSCSPHPLSITAPFHATVKGKREKQEFELKPEN